MNELVKKLMEAGKQEALKSEETLRAAAKELGASDAEIDACIKALGGFPLDDGALEQASGGYYCVNVPTQAKHRGEIYTGVM